jgi:WD40 repeat protein
MNNKDRQKLRALATLALLLLTIAGVATSQREDAGLDSQGTRTFREFSQTASTNTPRQQHTATLLPNGKILVAGGVGNPTPLTSAELYDPPAGTFTFTGSMNSGRYGHTATLLRNGKVLFAGGCCDSLGAVLTSAELFDPVTGTFTPTGSMGVARVSHTATPLPDGSVLIAGGWRGPSATRTAELYDLNSGTFIPINSMGFIRSGHTATLLANGQVLVAGAVSPSFTNTAETYDATSRTWSSTGPMTSARGYHAAALLKNGTVLIAGGQATNAQYLASAEIYDPKLRTFSATGSMVNSRSQLTATRLANGQVLITGGFGFFAPYESGTLSTAELYYSASKTFVATQRPMTSSRQGQVATLLADGRHVLVNGGLTADPSSAEMFSSQGKTPCTPGLLGCPWRNWEMFTVTQGDWGNVPDGANPASLLFAGYESVYAPYDVFIVGNDSYFEMFFGSADTLNAYLPATGTPGVLDSDVVDPTWSSSGEFGGDVSALKLDVDFSDAGLLHGTQPLRFGDLRLCGLTTMPDLNNLTVRQALDALNLALSSGPTSDSIADLETLTRELEAAFYGGTVSAFANDHLLKGTCL